MVTLKSIILHAAKNTIEDLESKGMVAAGHNGPYNDPETPVRNTGHWLITFSRAFEWTGEEKYRIAALRCATYLLSKEARPHEFSFHHRNGPKDHCNGLVGQAWTFESLAEATKLFHDQKYAYAAEEVFLQHPFDEEIGLWNRLEVNGKILPLDTALNHQLWFAACAGMIEGKHTKTVRTRTRRFLDCLEKNLTVLHNGLLYHPIEHLFDEQLTEQLRFSKRLRIIIRACYFALQGIATHNTLKSRAKIRQEVRNKLVYKSIGYHSFNMYAFALLKPQFPDHIFWETESFKQMLNYVKSHKYREDLTNNKYSYAYNPPGFEVPYSRLVLENLELAAAIEITTDWVSEQIRICFNPKTCQFDSNTEDPITHTARIYEVARMSQAIAEKVVIKLAD